MDLSSVKNNKNPIELLYIIIAVVIGIAMVYFNSHKYHLGFFGGILGVILSILGSFIGIKIGDFIRKLTIPDTIWATGGMWEILKAKIFWFIGPQAIGAILGSAAGFTVVAQFFK